MHAPPWPRLLACWRAGRLRTVLLHSDGRRAHAREDAVSDAVGLTLALAEALAATHRDVRHAALVTDDEAAVGAEALRAALGLTTLCLLPRDRALGLALAEPAPTRWLLPGPRREAAVLCRVDPAALFDADGDSPAPLTALLRQPWQGRALGAQLGEGPLALATLCGLLALAGHGLIVLRGDAARREALAGFDWAAALARYQAPQPAIAWQDEDDQPCWPGAARALERALQAPAAGAVCTRIREGYAGLTRSERRVADVVLANPAAALQTATARLAEAAGVSQPQVIRFCRALGFDGVSAFKHALAASLASTGENDGHPLLTRSAQALRGLDRSTLGRAAETLAGAAQVDVLADAAHAPLLDLALHALWRAGISARKALPGARAAGSACLALGGGAMPPAGMQGVWITECARAADAAVQLVTGPEAECAPALLAALALQLLLADVAAVAASRRGLHRRARQEGEHGVDAALVRELPRRPGLLAKPRHHAAAGRRAR